MVLGIKNCIHQRNFTSFSLKKITNISLNDDHISTVPRVLPLFHPKSPIKVNGSCYIALWSAKPSESFSQLCQNLEWLCQYLSFLNIFWPVVKCGIIPQCLYRYLLTLKPNLQFKQFSDIFCGYRKIEHWSKMD